jgi:DNA-3-methyladenine glycosylase II
MVKQIPLATKQDLLDLSRKWQPYRSIATMLLWHYYIKKKNIKILH